MQEKPIQVDIRIPSDTRYLSLIGKIGEDLVKGLNGSGVDKETLAYHLNIVLTEAAANAIKYAHHGYPGQSVHISIAINDKELFVKVYDNGPGFDIDNVPLPDFENPDDRGRGIYIMKCLMDSVSYKRLEGANVLEMSKLLK